MSYTQRDLPEATTILINKKSITLSKLGTATDSYLATYEVQQGGSTVGKIDIPKDYLVKSVDVSVVTVANKPISGYQVGDKYFDFIINTLDNSGSDEHIYVNVNDLVDIYEADGSSLELYTQNGVKKFRVKSGGITSAHIANGTIVNEDISGNADIAFSKLNISKNDITALGIPAQDTTYTPASNTPKPDSGVSGTVGTGTKYAREDHIHPSYNWTSGGTAGTTGYAKIAQIKINSTYQDSPIELILFNRSRQEPTYCYVKFKNANNTTPDLDSIKHKGQNQTIYIHKDSDSIWSIIALKSEGYDSYKVIVNNPNAGIAVTQLNEQVTLPTSTSTNPLTASTYIGFTAEEKTKLNGIEAEANKITKTSQLTNDGDDGTNVFVKNNDSRLSDVRNPKFNDIAATSSNLKDLDNYTTGGFYYCKSDVNSARYISNCPLTGSNNKSFFLLVEQWDSTAYIKQTLTYYHNNETYIRTKQASAGWKPWRKTTEVSFNPTKTSGIEIGTLTINGVETKIYQQDNNTTYTLSSLKDSNAHSNIGSNANASQADINTAIDSKISTLATKDEIDSITAGNVTLTGYVKQSDIQNNLTSTDTNKPLSAAQGKLLNTAISTKTVTVEKISTEAGYAASYVVKQNGTKVGATINIPKDFLVKSATLETCATTGTPTGMTKGDKYIDFVVNTIDNSGTATHIYLKVQDLIDVYEADGTSIELYTDNGVQKFRVKDGGITTAKIANSAVTSAKIADGTIVNADIASNAAIAYSKLSGVAPTSHTDSNGAYGKATTGVWGHTKLNNAVNSTDETTAATPKAVKTAYDIAKPLKDRYDGFYNISTGTDTSKPYYRLFNIHHSAGSSKSSKLIFEINSATSTQYAKIAIYFRRSNNTSSYMIIDVIDSTNFNLNDIYFAKKHTSTGGDVDIFFRVAAMNSYRTKYYDDHLREGTVTQFHPTEGDIEAYTSIESAATTLYDSAYTEIVQGTSKYNIKASSIEASSIIKTDGTSTQFLKADGSVDSKSYIENTTGTVTSNNILDKTIVNGDIADTTIQGGKLVNGTITATQLGSNAVETAKIKDSNVTTAKIADNAITNDKISDKTNLITEYIIGTQTASTSAWTGKSTKISSLAAGQIIFYKLPYASTSTAVTLNLTLADGSTTGAKEVWFWNEARLTTHYGVNSVIGLVYNGTQWWVINPSNNNNNYYLVSAEYITTGEAISSGGLMACKKEDGKYYKLSSLANNVIDITRPILAANGNLSSGANGNGIQVWNPWLNITITKSGFSGTAYQPVYIEGVQYSNGRFVLSSANYITQTLTKGNFYIHIGQLYNATSMGLNLLDQRVLYYDGNNLIPVNNIDGENGGTNLIPDTKAFGGVSTGAIIGESYKGCNVRRFNNVNGSTYVNCTWNLPKVGDFTYGDKFTLSFWAKGTGNIICYSYGDANYVSGKPIKHNGIASATGYSDGNTTFSLTEEWKRYYVTWVLNPTAASNCDDSVLKKLLIRTLKGTDSYIAGPMFERGDIAHDWSPAPEDKIDTAGTGLTKSNTTLSIANSGVTATQLASNAVETAKIKDSAVTSVKIADGTIVNADIASNAAIAYSKLSGVAPTTHTHHDTDLNWNGVSLANQVSPVDMAMYEEFSANRLAFLSGENIIVEYSTNGGSTWTETATDATGKTNKTKLVTTKFYPPGFEAGNGATKSVNNQLRITLKAGEPNVASKVYMYTRKLMVFFSTGGSNSCKCKIETSTYGTPTTWTNVGTYNVDGYSGWNSIPLALTFGGFSNQTNGTRIQNIRLTFTCTTVGSYNFSVQKIRLFGELCWAAPSALAGTGHVYTFDENQNATFPGKIIKSGGTSAQFLKADGSVDGTTYVSGAGTGLTKDGANLKHSNSVIADTTGNFKKLKYDAQGHITGAVNVAKADITGLGISASDHTHSYYPLTPTQIANGTDLNTIMDSGLYAQKTTSNTSNMLNLPNDIHKAFSMIVDSYGDSGRVQKLTFWTYSDETTQSFIRTGGNSGWSEWVEITDNYSHPTQTAITGVPTGNTTIGTNRQFTVSQPVVNTLGHVTALNTRTYTIPQATTSTDGAMTTSQVTALGKKIDTAGTSMEISGTTMGVKNKGITATQIADTTIKNAQIATDAAIAFSKLSISKANITGLGISASDHGHGSLANGGTLNSDISSVNKIAVTDSSNNLKTISKLPADKVTHQDISGKSDVGHTHTVGDVFSTDGQSDLTAMLSSKAQKNHAVNSSDYGLATTGVYGHTKVIQNLTTNDGNGLALGAGQGKALKALVDAKWTTAPGSIGDGKAGFDYNDQKTPGSYIVWGQQQGNCTNAPNPNGVVDTQGGLLLIYSIPNGVVQILINYWKVTPQIFYRIWHNSGVWRSWQVIYTQENTPSASTTTKGIVQLGTDSDKAAPGNHNHKGYVQTQSDVTNNRYITFNPSTGMAVFSWWTQAINITSQNAWIDWWDASSTCKNIGNIVYSSNLANGTTGAIYFRINNNSGKIQYRAESTGTGSKAIHPGHITFMAGE